MKDHTPNALLFRCVVAALREVKMLLDLRPSLLAGWRIQWVFRQIQPFWSVPIGFAAMPVCFTVKPIGFEQKKFTFDRFQLDLSKRNLLLADSNWIWAKEIYFWPIPIGFG